MCPHAKSEKGKGGKARLFYLLPFTFCLLSAPLPTLHSPLPTLAQTAPATAGGLSQQGEGQLLQAELPTALQTFQQVIALRRQANDVAGEAAALDRVGEVYLWQGEADRALPALQSALQLRRQIGDQAGEAETLAKLGDGYSAKKQYPEAAKAFQQALAIQQKTGDRAGEAYTRWLMGANFVSQDQDAQGLEQLQQAQALLPQVQDAARRRILGGRILGWIGWTQSKLKQPEPSAKNLQQALSSSREGGDRLMEFSTQVFLGRSAIDAGQANQALEYYQAALTIGQRMENQNSIALLQNQIGIAHYNLKKYPEALTAFQQALATYGAIKNQAEVAQVLANIGSTYKEQKQYEAAIAPLQQALTLYQQLDNQKQQAYVLGEIGYAYYFQSVAVMRQQKDYAQAEKLAQQGLQAYQQKLEVVRKTADRPAEQNTLMGVGFAYQQRSQVLFAAGRYEESLEPALQALEVFQQRLAIARELKQPETIKLALQDVAGVYYTLTLVYNENGQPLKALEYSQKQRATAAESGNEASQASALKSALNVYSKLTNFYRDQGQYAEEIEASEQAVALARQLNKPETEILYLNGIANVHNFQGRHDQALEIFQQILTRAREIGDRNREIVALNGIAFVYGYRGDYAQELAFYQQGLQASQRYQIPQLEAIGFNNIATVYKIQGDYAQSLMYLERSLTTNQTYAQQWAKGVTADNVRSLCKNDKTKLSFMKELCLQPEKLPVGFNLDNLKSIIQSRAELHQALISTTLSNIGKLYEEQGNYPKALDYYQQALAIAKALNDQGRQATYLSNTGSVMMAFGDYPQAFELTQQALKIAQAQRDPWSETSYRANLGEVYRGWGRYPEAIAEYERGLELARKSGQTPNEAGALNNLGIVYFLQGRYAKSMEFYQQGLQIHQKLGSPANIATVLSNLGVLHRYLGQYDQSLALHQQGLDTYRKVGVRPRQALALLAIAATYREQGNYGEALSQYQQALAIFRDIKHSYGEAQALYGIGKVHLKQGQATAAIAALQQALTTYRQLGVRPDAGMALSALGQAYTGAGQAAAAGEVLQQSLTIAQEVGDRSTEAEALGRLGQLFTHQRQPELAIVFYKEAVNVQEQIRQGLKTLSRSQQESYTQTVASTYRNLADLLLKQDRVLEAQQVLDLLKVQELNDYLRTVRGANQPIDFLRPETEILKKYNAVQKSAVELGQELAQLRQVPDAQRSRAQQQRLAQLVQLEKDLNAQFNEFQRRPDVTALLQQLSHTTRRQTVDLEDLNTLRTSLGRVNAVLLYPLILDDRLELIITTPNAAPLRRTVPVKRATLNAAILEFRLALQDPAKYSRARELGQQLYGWLIKPIEADLNQAKAETIIYAPDGQLRYIPLAALHDGQGWLVQRYRVNNITAKSLMGDRFEAKLPAKPKVLAGAFSDSATQYAVKVGQRNFSFAGLPYAKQEVTKLAAEIPGTKPLVDKAFSLAAVEPRMNEHNILHFATHAAFVPGQPEDSFIVFGDGKLATLRDIENWSLQNVDLVVLSACETGLGGKLGNGEEILGLGYQFQNRGAKATVASLWKVQDDGTSVLMDTFYARLQKGLPKSEALRQAQIDLLKNPTYRHPLYWAPFVLIGNGL